MTEENKHIKVRPPGKKRYGFLTPKGGMNYLRIHASIIDDPAKADRIAQEIRNENPGWDAKVVPAFVPAKKRR